MYTGFCWGNLRERRKKATGRPRHRWEDNIKMDLQEMGSEGMDLDRYVLGQGQGQVRSTCDCSIELSGSIKCVEFLD